MPRALATLAIAALLVAPASPAAAQTTPPSPAAAAGYVVSPPEGKLPWPHHAPSFTQAQYDAMMDTLFIINNFGLYQGGDTRDSVYFHSGVDVVARNGTPIHSIAAGTVRAIMGSAPYYLTVIVEDAAAPGWAWGYTHITPDPGITPGAPVAMGARVGTVRFQGLEHLHLNRMFLKEGGVWHSMVSHGNIDPMPFFDYVDTEPPVIEEGFYYFLNESHDMFTRGRPTFVSGEVDIVAGISDPGKNARGPYPGSTSPTSPLFGDRNAPTRIDVSIASARDPGRVLWEQTAMDFRNVVLDYRWPAMLRDPDRVETVYAFRPAINPNAFRNRGTFSYYFLTNRSRAVDPPTIEPTDGAPSWDTTAVDAEGRRLFPDGDYIVTVTAWDEKGNMASARDVVIVLNR